MRYSISVNVILLIVLLPVLIYGQERSLNVIYTGHMDGELEPCGCSPKTDFGGLARLSGWLGEKGKDLLPYVLVDAGNFAPQDTPQGRLKVKAMLKSFSITGYDAVALLKRETVFKDDLVPDVIKNHSVPVISSLPPFGHSVSVKENALEIHISIDPKHPRKGALNILLTDLPASGFKEINGWDIIITSSGEIIEDPLENGKAVIVSGYPKGKKLGVLSLEINGDGEIEAFRHEWYPLGNEIKEDIRVRSVLNEYDTGVAALLKDAERPPAGTTYAGVAKCAECHQLFEESWKESRHAGAFASLERAGKASDPECLICHTVGFGEEGGFFSIETTPELANVQCEVCHGLNREHLTEFSKPLRPVTEKICLKCHTESNSPDFDYEEYREKIIH